MFLALNLVLTKKQIFGECNSIECNSIEYNSVEFNSIEQTYKWEKSDK